MKLHFPWSKVAKALSEVRAATVVKPLYGEDTGKGLWLVGDEGVYLMPNTEGETRTIVYAKECDPTKLDFYRWWHVKHATFGGDDGVEFISIEEIERISAGPSGARLESLCIDFTPKRMTISVQRKRVARKGAAA
jgi:Protein of unknown function (DUF3085)